MIQLEEGYKIGEYRVSYFIKEGLFNGTYRIADEKGESFFMKFYDFDAVPDKLRVKGEVLEIVLSRRVSHENVISYVTDGKTEIDGKSYHYLITGYFHGMLLSDLMERRKTLPFSEAKDLMRGVLEGLSYLHSLGLNHNDLTPRNILLEEVGRDTFAPRIIDLGHLCPSLGGAPPFPVNDLTLPYCAPEALTGIFEAEGDTFSAAAIFFSLITGKTPWPCELDESESFTQKKKIVRQARREPLDLEALSGKDVPAEIIDLIAKGLELDSEKRIGLPDLIRRLYGGDISRTQGRETQQAQASMERDMDPQAAATSANVEIKKVQGGGFSDVAGMERLKAELTNRVIWILREKEKAEKYRLTPPNGMILYGPPGCGKTYFAEKFAEESQFNFVLVNGSDLGSIYLHGTQGKIANLFKEAEKNAPTIICFDEFDSFVPSRSSMAAEHRPEEVNEFLGQLNNCSKKGIFVIGTTNRLDLIDPAVLRKGRMDLHVEIPAPDEKTRGLIFSLHLKDRPVSDDINCEELAKMTDHYAASDIAFIVNEAAMTAAMADEPISQKHLENSIKANKSSLAGNEPERKKIGF